MWGLRSHVCFWLHSSSVHPHTCGVYDFVLARKRRQVRFIPTHVGFTGRQEHNGVFPPVHPHACGVYACASFLRANHDGSSPHMWGLLLNVHLAVRPQAVHPHTCGVYLGYIVRHKCKCRFIPTHVGFTMTRFACSCIKAVHPHTCGVYPIRLATYQSPVGSSPRMWGLRAPANSQS